MARLALFVEKTISPIAGAAGLTFERRPLNSAGLQSEQPSSGVVDLVVRKPRIQGTATRASGSDVLLGIDVLRPVGAHRSGVNGSLNSRPVARWSRAGGQTTCSSCLASLHAAWTGGRRR